VKGHRTSFDSTESCSRSPEIIWSSRSIPELTCSKQRVVDFGRRARRSPASRRERAAPRRSMPRGAAAGDRRSDRREEGRSDPRRRHGARTGRARVELPPGRHTLEVEGGERREVDLGPGSEARITLENESSVLGRWWFWPVRPRSSPPR